MFSSFSLTSVRQPLVLAGLGLLSAALVGCVNPPQSKTEAQPVLTKPESSQQPPASIPGTVETPAVAARFTQPKIQFSTPAFEEGREAFTTQAELQALMKKLTRNSRADTANPLYINLVPLGKSQSGATLEALLFSRNSSSKPSDIARAERPTVFLMGQQHGDEPATAEALLALAQELAQDSSLQAVLDRINVVIFPRTNPDGAALKQAASANGTDINRDHLLLRTPEAKAIAQILQNFQPIVVLDAHEYPPQPLFVEKFGNMQAVDAMLQYTTAMNEHEFITKAAEEWFRRPMLASLKSMGATAEWHYSTSASPEDKLVSMGGVQPNTARNVIGLRNTVTFMIETRGAGFDRQHLKRRVQTQLNLMTSALRSAAIRASDLTKVKKFVDATVKAQACQGNVSTDAQLKKTEYTLQLMNPTTGVDVPVSVSWESALSLTNLKTVPRPCGYWLAADQFDSVARLRNLGLKVEQFTEATVLQNDQRSESTATGNTKPDQFEAPIGSYYVSLAQPLANLAVAAMEPSSKFGYLAQGVVSAPDRVAPVSVRPKAKRY
jgi:hypothetical protein